VQFGACARPEDAAWIAEAGADFIEAHVHIAEPDGRVPPGPGMAGCRPFLAKLGAIGYDRRISIECTWTGMRAELAPSLAFLRSEWEAA